MKRRYVPLKANEKIHSVIFPVLAVCMLFFLVVGGMYFNRYLQNRIFEERTTQLNEITSQVQANLDSSLDSHWNYLAAAVNLLEREEYGTAQDLTAGIRQTEALLEMENYSSSLMLLDSHGNYYDADGKHGVWHGINMIAGGEERCTFIAESITGDGNYWAFVQELPRPLSPQSSRESFSHAVLLKDMHTLTEYYQNAAYGSQNETYVLKSDGTRLHDDISRGSTIQAYNVLKVLQEMEGQRYTDIRAALGDADTVSANFTYNGTQYYYCLASVKQYDMLVLFLIPADYVASDTVEMVGAVIRMLLILAVILVAMLILIVISITRQRNSAKLFKQEQESLRRLEAVNGQLAESNALLAQAKESAEQAFRMAEEANRAKSSFLSNMSHDIRTPMNAIVGFAALLARDVNNPEKVMEYTRKITASSQHLLGLINDILDISKIEAGKTALNLSDESIVELIENLDSIIRPQMKAKGHTFEIYSRDLRHEQVRMDKLRLNQILLNLLSNAVKYTPDGGHVTLTVQELPSLTGQLLRFRFVVADNGYGMSQEYQQKIFHAFTREEDSVTSKIQGTGLGMAITKNLLDLMGGTISLESQKGKGTTFTVELELQAGQEDADPDFWKNHGIGRILSVDDEEIVCLNIRTAMEGTGVAVDYALDGQTAVDMAVRSGQEGHPYHAVLLDWKMPGMDGLETARRIRSRMPEDMPILVLTGYDWPEIEEAARAAGIDAFLSKPFFLTGFRQRIDSLLGRKGETSSPQEHREQSVLHGMHLLVAEDNEINAEILSELLQMSGATCEICDNGKAVVEAFEKSVPGQYQVILMDVQMPVMNGYEATGAIRESNHPMALKIPIIAMTANAFAEDVRAALEAGMNAHASKPIDMTVLEHTVRAVLEAQSES
ncbi:MAG: response regulator [Lachnospiraceae bacterium]|nr:response regulator [Lachnospiraceae bacterium]